MSTIQVAALTGFIGGPELVIIFVILLLGCIPVAIIVGVVLFVNRKKRDAAAAPISPQPNQDQKTEDGEGDVPTQQG